MRERIGRIVLYAFCALAIGAGVMGVAGLLEMESRSTTLLTSATSIVCGAGLLGFLLRSRATT